MKKPITILLLLTTVTSFSQVDREKPGPWKIGLMFSPDFYLTSSNVFGSSVIEYELEPSEFTFTTGIISLYTLHPSLDIGSGITYSKKDYTSELFCYTCDLGYDVIEPIQQRFVEIPLFVRYRIVDNKVGVYVETGLSGSYLAGDISTEFGGELPRTNDFLFSAHLGLGANLVVGEGINIGLAPTYRRTFTEFYKGSGFRFNSFGITTSVTYQILTK